MAQGTRVYRKSPGKEQKDMIREKVINVRMTEEEFEQMKNTAAAMGMSVSDYVRSMAGGIEAGKYDPEVRNAVFEMLSLLREYNTLNTSKKEPGQEKNISTMLHLLLHAADAMIMFLDSSRKKV